MQQEKNIPFWEKYTLTVSEACAYFHIGDKKFRQILWKIIRMQIFC